MYTPDCEELHCDRLLSSTLSDEDARDLANVIKALADPIRLRLVNLIGIAGEACACDFPAAVDRSQATVSHHLKLLTQAGILEREQRGKWAWFRVDQERLAQMRSVIC